MSRNICIDILGLICYIKMEELIMKLRKRIAAIVSTIIISTSMASMSISTSANDSYTYGTDPYIHGESYYNAFNRVVASACTTSYLSSTNIVSVNLVIRYKDSDGNSHTYGNGDSGANVASKSVTTPAGGIYKRTTVQHSRNGIMFSQQTLYI